LDVLLVYLFYLKFLYLDRIGMDNDLPNSSDIEQELEKRRIQVKIY